MLPQKAGQVKHICRLKFTILLKGGVDFRSQYKYLSDPAKTIFPSINRIYM